MSRRAPITLPTARFWNADQVASWLGRSPGWFAQHLDGLVRDHGFPTRDSVVKLWDSHEIEAWVDIRHGLSGQMAAESVAMEAFGGENRASVC